MSETKHTSTPGPWQVGGDGTWIQTNDNGVPVICDLVPRDADSFTAEDDANARLIAAAPDLLAAVEKLLPRSCQARAHASPNYNEGKDCGTCGYCIGRAAIAKAKGE